MVHATTLLMNGSMGARPARPDIDRQRRSIPCTPTAPHAVIGRSGALQFPAAARHDRIISPRFSGRPRRTMMESRRYVRRRNDAAAGFGGRS
jgi:hypothetical protein